MKPAVIKTDDIKNYKRPVFIFAFGMYKSKQVNVSGIQIFRLQFLALHLRKVMLNAANIYLFGIIHTKCKYIYRSFLTQHIVTARLTEQTLYCTPASKLSFGNIQ